jgi:hypothetical protein
VVKSASDCTDDLLQNLCGSYQFSSFLTVEAALGEATHILKMDKQVK